MHVIGSKMAAQMVKDINPCNATKLLDIGSASGTYAEAFLKECPGMCATLSPR